MGLLTKNSKASIYFIFVTLVIESMGFGVIMPVLPDVIRKFIQGEAEIATTFGYFVAVYAGLQFFVSPILGRLSDKFGRRPILLISLFGTGLDYLFMALAPTLPLLFIGRVVAGISGASFTVASAYIADISDESNRAKNFGIMGAGFGMGFILGPAIGGVAAHYGLMVPFIVAAVLNLLNFLFGVFILPESLPESLRRSFAAKDLNPLKSLQVLGSMPKIAFLVVAYFMLNLAGQTHPSIWAIYTESRYGWSSGEVGMSLAAVGILSAISQGGLTGVFVKWFGERKLVVWGLMGEAMSFALFGAATTGFFAYATLVLSSLFWSCHPSLQSLISSEIPADRQGELQGALMSLASLTAILNPLIMTAVFARTSVAGGAIYIPGMPYYLASAFLWIAFAFILKGIRHQNAKQDKQ